MQQTALPNTPMTADLPLACTEHGRRDPSIACGNAGHFDRKVV